MERDFLAAIGNDQQQQQAREESVYFGGGGGAAPAMDWSFGSKPGAAPALMSFRSPARDEPTFPHFSGFDGAARTPAPSRTLTRQRSIVADSHGTPQYAMNRPQQPPQPQQHALNGARAVPVSSPFNSQNNPMFRVQSSPNLPNGVAGGGTSFKQPPFAVNNTVAGSTVGVYGTRDVQKPKNTAQLTIFYAGSVNVFDNVSAEKAQELMFLASRGSSLPSSTPVARRPEAPVFSATKITVPDQVSPAKHDMVFQKPQHVSPPSSSTSRPITTGVSRPASLPRSASSSNVDSTVPKSSSPLAAVPPIISQAPLGLPPTISQLAPSTQPATLAVTTAAAIMPRAVPQARKASLARFLEKRKERVTTTAAPYSSTKTETTSDTFGSTSAANDKSSCTDIAPSSNRDEPLPYFGPQPARNVSFGRSQASIPSTKLQI